MAAYQETVLVHPPCKSQAEIILVDRILIPGAAQQDTPHRMEADSKRLVGRSIFRICSLHNDDLPVNRLPNELLLQVFVFVKNVDRGMAWIRLTHVCHRWREFAITTPSLWTGISVENGLSLLQMCLRRSGDAPISITSRGHLTDVRVLLDTIQPHMQQVRNLQFGALSHPAIDAVSAALKGSMPVLESLTLRMRSDYTAPELLHPSLIDCHFPRLRALSLEGISISRHCLIATGLVRLELSNVFASLPAPAEAAVGLLYRFPLLEHLTIIENTRILQEDQYRPSALSVVSLPRLQNMRLVADTTFVSNILAHVMVSASTVLHIKCPLNAVHSHNTPIAAAIPRDRSGFANLAEVRSLNLFVTSNIFRVQAFESATSSSSKRLELEVECHPPVDLSTLLAPALCELTKVFASSPVIDLQVLGDQHHISESHWQQSLVNIPLLQCLQVGSRGDVKPLFKALCPSPVYLSDGLPCPNLKKLCVDGANCDEETLDVITASLDSRMSRKLRIEALSLRRLIGRGGKEVDASTVDILSTMVDVFDCR